MRTSARRRREARGRRRLAEGFVAALSFLAGLTDAIGFLLAGEYVSFMSGNTTNLAVAIGEGHLAALARGALVIVLFVAGNALSAFVMAFTGGRQAVLLLLVAGCALVPAGFEAPVRGIPAFVFAMGLLNGAMDQVEGRGVGLTYVTGALTRIGRGIGRRLLGDRSDGWHLQVWPWLGVLAGGLAGALAFANALPGAILLPAILAAFLAIVADAIPPTWRRRYLALPVRPERR
ncbi:YoaK family protein [Aureimonas sp. AU4]|uniref:YoaK family protein n=1 Tax=Aureimonas sp. AU4 TaxID=1638163 RepID=UPI000780B423|nr:DUF1275 family protein [Aureimonas sp. AU4]